MQDPQAPLPPPYSCRSQLSVCLNTQGPEGGLDPQPFKLWVKKREELGSTHHVVSMDEMTWEQVGCSCTAGLLVLRVACDLACVVRVAH